MENVMEEQQMSTKGFEKTISNGAGIGLKVKTFN